MAKMELKAKLEIKKLRPREVEVCDYIRVVSKPIGGHKIYIDGVEQTHVVGFSVDLTVGKPPTFKITRVIP